MSDLTEFLLARIAEDEAAAEAAARHWHDDCLDAPVAQVELHAYRHDPARVLADLEAKRQIVELRQRADVPESASGFVRGQDDGFRQALDEALRLLALPYADHPGWRPEWRP